LIAWLFSHKDDASPGSALAEDGLGGPAPRDRNPDTTLPRLSKSPSSGRNGVASDGGVAGMA
jgi:hypothetical protein